MDKNEVLNNLTIKTKLESKISSIWNQNQNIIKLPLQKEHTSESQDAIKHWKGLSGYSSLNGVDSITVPYHHLLSITDRNLSPGFHSSEMLAVY